MYNVRDTTQVKWIDYAWNEKNPDGSETFPGENLIQILATGEIWSYHVAIEKGLVFDEK